MSRATTPRKACDEHYTYVAMNPRVGPGAYAACTGDPAYAKYARNFKRRETRKGAVVKLVTCNEAQKLLGKFLVGGSKPQEEK